MCMEQLHVVKCAWPWSSAACACHQNVSLTESIAQLKDTDHARSYDTKNILVHFTALKQSGRSRGPRAVSVSVATLLPPRMTSSFSADASSVMTGHSEFSVTLCRPVKFPSSGDS